MGAVGIGSVAGASTDAGDTRRRFSSALRIGAAHRRYATDSDRRQQPQALYRRSLAIIERAFGPDHPHVTTTLNNLGAALYVRGDFDEAWQVRSRALAST